MATGSVIESIGPQVEALLGYPHGAIHRRSGVLAIRPASGRPRAQWRREHGAVGAWLRVRAGVPHDRRRRRKWCGSTTSPPRSCRRSDTRSMAWIPRRHHLSAAGRGAARRERGAIPAHGRPFAGRDPRPRRWPVRVRERRGRATPGSGDARGARRPADRGRSSIPTSGIWPPNARRWRSTGRAAPLLEETVHPLGRSRDRRRGVRASRWGTRDGRRADRGPRHLACGRRSRNGSARAEERYRVVVEHIPAVVYVEALEGDPERFYISPQVEAIFGYTAEEWRLTPDFWLDHVHPDDRPRVSRVRRAHERRASHRSRSTTDSWPPTADGDGSTTRPRSWRGRTASGFWQGFIAGHHGSQAGRGTAPGRGAEVPLDRRAERGDLLHAADRSDDRSDLEHHVHRAGEHGPDRLLDRGDRGRPDPVAADHPSRTTGSACSPATRRARRRRTTASRSSIGSSARTAESSGSTTAPRSCSFPASPRTGRASCST